MSINPQIPHGREGTRPHRPSQAPAAPAGAVEAEGVMAGVVAAPAVDNPTASSPGSATLPVRGPTPEVVRGPERARPLRRLTRAVPTAQALRKVPPARRVLAVVVVLAATLSAHGGSVSAAAAGSLASPGAASVARRPVLVPPPWRPPTLERNPGLRLWTRCRWRPLR